jgi:Tfp pilus assembly protein PilX
MTEQPWKMLWSILICAVIITLIAVVVIQQSWVKRRFVEATPSAPERPIVQPKIEAASGVKAA